MEKNEVTLWVWVYNGEIMKAVVGIHTGTLIIYNEQDHIILKWKGLTPKNLSVLKEILLHHGAKQMNPGNKSFTYL